MRKRNNRISLYLDDKELEAFNRKLKKSGLNCSTYLRQLVKGYGPTPMPDDRFWSYMNRISELTDMIDEIAFRMGKPDEIINIMMINARAYLIGRYALFFAFAPCINSSDEIQ